MKGFLLELPERAEPPMFVYIRMPEDIDPVERQEDFGEPLDLALRSHAIGEVTGGGTALSAPDEDGDREVEYCGIDVDLSRPRDGVLVLLAELRRLGVPKRTMIEFEIGDTRHQLDVYGNAN